MNRTFVGIAFPAVLFGLACGGGLPPDPPPGTHGEVGSPDGGEFERFASSGYTWCDASVLAWYWGESTGDAKLRIGRKIGWGDYGILSADLIAAQGRARTQGKVLCAYHEEGFDYDDAVVLARLWGVETWDAKSKMDQMLTWGQRAELVDLLSGGPLGGEGGEGDMGDVPMIAVFEQSTYTFCDASLIGQAWGTHAYDGKVTIGYKLSNGWGYQIPPLLETARTTARASGFRCNFWESTYTYDDAVALGRLWGMDVVQAKAQVEEKLFAGNNAVIQSELGRARAGG